ncbi:MAG: hypothetical protein HY216_01965 [Candidatus Rokubacteria bacterium]|nr:hypothetical protein [Candidatus Rokubacteria bacterium]
MRVTQSSLTTQALAAIQGALSRMATAQNRLATGRELTAPSDDPAGHAAATRLDGRLAGLAQFQRQAGTARDMLTASDALAGDMSNLLARAQELALAGADGGKGAAERAAMAAEVDGLLEEVVSRTNQQDNGSYLLGGRETLTAPLNVTRVAGQITVATWNPRGVDGSIVLDVSESSAVQINVGGTSVLGADTDPTFLPAVLVTLRDALATNNAAAVNGTLANLQAAQTRLNNTRATVGVRLAGLDRSDADLDTTTLAAKSALSALLDADMPRAAVELNQQQVVYQAALQAAAKALQPSLVEFLR